MILRELLCSAEHIGAAAGKLVQRADPVEARFAVGAGRPLADAFAERILGMIGATGAIGIDGDARKRGEKLPRRFCALDTIDQNRKVAHRLTVARQIHLRWLEATELV